MMRVPQVIEKDTIATEIKSVSGLFRKLPT